MARVKELGSFYERCPALGVTCVFHAGAGRLNRVPGDLAATWPQVEGVKTVRVVYSPQQADSYGALMAREGRSDWVTCPPVLSLTHGARSGPSVDLVFIRDPGAARTLSAIAAELRIKRANRPWVAFVAGHRAIEHKYVNRCCIASVGVFHARRAFKKPPLPFGGSIVEIKLADDGSLDYCETTFRDMSGGMPDLRRPPDQDQERAASICSRAATGR